MSPSDHDHDDHHDDHDDGDHYDRDGRGADAGPDRLCVRPLRGPEELPLFRRLPGPLDHEPADDLAAGRRRLAWMWLALHGARPVARAAWWGLPGDELPRVLEVFDLDEAPGAAARPARVETGHRLLTAASSALFPDGGRPEFSCFLPRDWRERPDVRRGVEDRTAALERTGARPLVERLRLEWRPPAPVPAPDGRLVFRPVRDGGAELVPLMTRVLEGTLDAHDRAGLSRMSAHEVATRHYRDELARYTSPRGWWRIATLPDGEPAGFVVPARNAYNAIIAYIGVLPAHRGRGLVDALLVEGTRVLAAEGVPRVRASTDVGNTPMAAAFARAGYRVFERQLTMVWDRPARTAPWPRTRRGRGAAVVEDGAAVGGSGGRAVCADVGARGGQGVVHIPGAGGHAQRVGHVGEVPAALLVAVPGVVPERLVLGDEPAQGVGMHDHEVSSGPELG